MNWIFDNLQLVIVVGSTIAWWLTQRKQGDEDDAPKPGDRPGREKIDFEQMERNRKLREEIRRKREQRQRGSDQPSPELQEREAPTRRHSPGMEVPEDVSEQIPPVLRELMGIPDPQPRAPEPTPPPLPAVNPVSERHDRMEQELAELETKRREAEALAAKVAIPGAGRKRRRRATSSQSLSDRDFLATLRDPRQARRAIVLREILGKPIALR